MSYDSSAAMMYENDSNRANTTYQEIKRLRN